MKTEDIKRLYYYEKQFLGARDFQDEQEYHIEMRRRHLIAHHRWGIVAGLEIAQDQDSKVWYLSPGIAIDAFGREIIVFEPEPLNTLAIAEQLAGQSLPAMLKVWLSYSVEKSNRPPQNFQVCGDADQFMRVRETFRLLYKNAPPFDLEQTASTLDQNPENRKTWPKAFQDLPDNPKEARWPIYLGTLVWNADPSNPAQNLITSVASLDPADNQRRRYVGVVAEELEAPDDRLLIRGRGSESPLPAASDGVSVLLEGRLEVSRQMTADRNLNVLGKAGIGIGKSEPDTRLQVSGGKAASLKGQTGYVVIGPIDDRNLVLDDHALMARTGQSASELQLQSLGGDLSVHFETPETSLVVRESGNVGIGTLAPQEKLEIAGGGSLLLRASQFAPEEPGSITFRNFNGQQKGKIWTEPGLGPGLFLSSGNTVPDIAIDQAGNVGVGTTTPQRKLHAVNEIHSSGASAGFSFSDRDVPAFIQHPLNGERWVWFAKGGVARLWSGNDKLIVDPADGLSLKGNLTVDDDDTNAGSHFPGVAFGHQSGECIASRRTPGLNQYGLDFYTKFLNRMSLTQSGDLGIGTSIPFSRLHVVSDVTGDDALPTSYVAILQNTAQDLNADVLALSVAANFPGSHNNYITFFSGDGPIGAIEGDGFTVALAGPGGDYAEWLPRLDEGERMGEGDVIGVFGGRITKKTEGAHHLMVISTRPIVLGNMPRPEVKHLHERVAFLGQVKVRVRGPVKEGDYILPSGREDGTALAVSARELAPRQHVQVIGRAWESSDREETRLINTAVGLPLHLPQTPETPPVVDALREELKALRAELEELRRA